MVKNLPANAGDTRDTGSVSGSGRSPEEGIGNPFQYACLENSMDKGALGRLQPMGVTKSQTQLSVHAHVHTHTHTHTHAHMERIRQSSQWLVKSWSLSSSQGIIWLFSTFLANKIYTNPKL